MLKLEIFLICALVASQGYEARSVEPDTLALRGILDKIKEMIEKIKNIISNITSQIPEIIKNIKDKIKEIIGKIPDRINEIKKKLEEIINAAGEIGRKCVEAQRDDIEALIQFAQFAIQGCVADAESSTEALKKQIEVLVKKANALRDDVVNRALQCAKDNPLNPSGVDKCLKEQVESNREEIIAIQKEFANIIAIAKEVAEHTSAALVECATKVHYEIAEREQKILENVMQCIKESTA